MKTNRTDDQLYIIGLQAMKDWGGITNISETQNDTLSGIGAQVFAIAKRTPPIPDGDHAHLIKIALVSAFNYGRANPRNNALDVAQPRLWKRILAKITPTPFENNA